MAVRIRKTLGNIAHVFRHDMGAILHNPVALIVIIGVLFLPSVYAWYTIAANMDPYAHTDAIKVAVANEDQPAEAPMVGTIDAGAEVIAELKQNDQLGWEFVSADEAREGVQSGRYYAAIVLPPDFSKDLISVVSGTFDPPKIEYYVNEKISAVAPEITNVGADTLEQKINGEFVATVSKAVATVAQSLGIEIRANGEAAESTLTASIERARQIAVSMESALGDLSAVNSSAQSTINSASLALEGLQDRLPAISATEAEAQQTLQRLRQEVATLGSKAIEGLSSAAAQTTEQATKAQATIGEARGRLTETRGLLEEQLQAAEAEGEAGTATAETLCQQIAVIDNALTELNTADNSITNALDACSSALSDAAASLGNSALPALNQALDEASAALGTIRGATTVLSPALSSANSALSQLSLTLDQAVIAASQAQAGLSDVDENLGEAKIEIAALASSATVQSLQNYLNVNPEELSSFMASPVKLETHEIYPVKNYGSGVAPFFTNLALWVAGFILVALLRLRIDRSEKDSAAPELTYTERYFGRGLLFLTLGVIQGLIVCIGDLVLGIQCIHPIAFIFAGVVTVFVDLNILYALVYTMRHLGRAIGVILLIMQIPGSSGEYPVQMMPAFFQFIHPLLPFTYSIDAMREAIGGMYGATYWIDLLCLMPFLVVAVLFGLVAGRYSFNLNVLFDRELSRTDLLISEEPGTEQEQFRLREVIVALLGIEGYREKLLQSMERYRRFYPRLVRGGWIFAAVTLTGALVLGRIFSTNVEARVIILQLMVLSLIVTFIYLIAVKFVDDRLAYRLQVSAMDQSDLRALATHHLFTNSDKPNTTSETAVEINESAGKS